MHDAGDERLKIFVEKLLEKLRFEWYARGLQLKPFPRDGREGGGGGEGESQSSEFRGQSSAGFRRLISHRIPLAQGGHRLREVLVHRARAKSCALASTMLSSLLLHTFPNMLPGPLSQENTSASGRNATSKHSSLPTAPRRIHNIHE